MADLYFTFCACRCQVDTCTRFCFFGGSREGEISMDRSELCGSVVVHVFAGDRVVIDAGGDMDTLRLLLTAVSALLRELSDRIK